MGNCIKRQRTPVRRIRQQRPEHQEISDGPYILVLENDSLNQHQSLRINPNPSLRISFQILRGRSVTEDNRQPKYSRRKLTEEDLDKHVLETLRILRLSAENDTDLLLRMRSFRSWANNETGWKMVLKSLIRAIPLEDPLGPSAITLFIDHCPLPTKTAVLHFVSELNLSKDCILQQNNSKSGAKHRNICAVLGHLTESLAPPFSQLILTDAVLDYLIKSVDAKECFSDVDATNILFSLIALEKMSQIAENKAKIMNSDITERLHSLEEFYSSMDFKKRQVGFLAQWLLDNKFIVEGRPYTYEIINLENLSAMLNNNDVSEYLKISADGLEARSDAPSFESVRCTFSVDRGVWFYEVTVITSGVMQIGWATKNSKFLNHDGFGIGDDEYSFAYDGCRRLCWYQALSSPHRHPGWKEGDTLGLLLDIDKCEVVFYLNGDPLPPQKSLFNSVKKGFFAAASFMSFQQCRFNFGAEPFKYPPSDRSFSTFNDCAILDDSEKKILPRHKKFQMLQRASIREDSCSICCDKVADTTLEPCGHDGICTDCAHQLELCHLCRAPIRVRILEPSITEMNL